MTVLCNVALKEDCGEKLKEDARQTLGWEVARH